MIWKVSTAPELAKFLQGARLPKSEHWKPVVAIILQDKLAVLGNRNGAENPGEGARLRHTKNARQERGGIPFHFGCLHLLHFFVPSPVSIMPPRAKPVDWDTPICYEPGKCLPPVDLLVMNLDPDFVHMMETKASTVVEQDNKRVAMAHLLETLQGYHVANISEQAINSKFKQLKKKLQEARDWRESTGAGLLQDAAADEEEAKASIHGMGHVFRAQRSDSLCACMRAFPRIGAQ